MKPGMFVTAQFSGTSDDAILIPANCVLQMEDSSFVFISLGNNKFLKRPIQIAGTDNDYVILKSGLKPADEIVTEGGIFLLETM